MTACRRQRHAAQQQRQSWTGVGAAPNAATQIEDTNASALAASSVAGVVANAGRMLTQDVRSARVPRGLGKPCFRTNPHGEVQWWADQMLGMSSEAAAQVWRGMPMYSEYILYSALESVMEESLHGLEYLQEARMNADDATELESAHGSLLPMPLAALARYVQITSGKPEQFIVRMKLRVQPFEEDPSVAIAPRFWSLPTGDVTVGKSPTFNMMRVLFLEAMKEVPEHFPFAHLPNANIHSNGSHGSFNERARAWQAHVAFLSSEATNQLSPDFPSSGRIDKKEFVNMKKLLEAATGGEYRWSTATEERARAAARPPAGQRQPDARQGNAGEARCLPASDFLRREQY